MKTVESWRYRYPLSEDEISELQAEDIWADWEEIERNLQPVWPVLWQLSGEGRRKRKLPMAE